MSPSRRHDLFSKLFPETKSWRSWQLRSWYMTIITGLHASFIATIASLLRVSQTKSGFVEVQQSKEVNTIGDIFSNDIWVSQFRWTLLPGLIMSLLAMGYGTMVNASAQRQPYVELIKRKKAKSAKLTILLDYPSQPAIYRWLVAFRNHHIWLGLAMLVQLVAAIVIGPLGSNLFKTKVIERPISIALGSPVGFDLQALHLGTDPGAAIEVANAVHMDGAKPPSWTTEQYAISPFVATDGELTGLVTAVTDVYYANLDCKVIPRTQLDVTFASGSLPNGGTVKIAFTDRGCSVEDVSFVVQPSFNHYANTWVRPCLNLPPFTDRFGIVIGTYAASSQDDLSQLITVSCIPSYHNSTASVGMSFEQGSAPQVESVDILRSSKLVSHRFEGFESGLPGYTIFDNSPDVSSDSFAHTVYEYALKLSGMSPPDANAAMEATQSIYMTMFAALVESDLFSPRQHVQAVSGEQFLTQTRLYVVPPVAYILLALLVLMFICSIGLFALALRRESILEEEPQGLLGSASVLFESNIFEIISDYYATTSHPQELVKYVKKHYSTKEATCWYVDPVQTNATQMNGSIAHSGQTVPVAALNAGAAPSAHGSPSAVVPARSNTGTTPSGQASPPVIVPTQATRTSPTVVPSSVQVNTGSVPSGQALPPPPASVAAVGPAQSNASTAPSDQVNPVAVVPPVQANVSAMPSGQANPAPPQAVAPAPGNAGKGTSFIYIENLKETNTTSPPNTVRRFWNGIKRLWH